MHTHNSFENLKPFVKWVGGKGSSVERLLQLIPEHIDTYVEPFVGSGALFFSLNFDKSIKITTTNKVNDETIAIFLNSKYPSIITIARINETIIEIPLLRFIAKLSRGAFGCSIGENRNTVNK